MAFRIKAWNILQGLEIIYPNCYVGLLLWLNSHCYSRVLIKKKKKDLLDLWICFFKNTENYLKTFILIETEPEGLFFVCIFVYLFDFFFLRTILMGNFPLKGKCPGLNTTTRRCLAQSSLLTFWKRNLEWIWINTLVHMKGLFPELWPKWWRSTCTGKLAWQSWFVLVLSDVSLSLGLHMNAYFLLQKSWVPNY